MAITEFDLLRARLAEQERLEEEQRQREKREIELGGKKLRDNSTEVLGGEDRYELTGGLDSPGLNYMLYKGREVMVPNPRGFLLHSWTAQRKVDFGADGQRTITVRGIQRLLPYSTNREPRPLEESDIFIGIDGVFYFLGLERSGKKGIWAIEGTGEASTDFTTVLEREPDIHDITFWANVMKLFMAAPPKKG